MPHSLRIVFLLLCLSASACSLLRFTVNTEDRPLSQQSLNIRTLVRGFHGEFSSQVIISSDSIIQNSEPIIYKLNALQWKIHATTTCTKAAFTSSPEASLLSCWVLCQKMNDFLSLTPDSLLFGNLSSLSRTSSSELLASIEKIASQNLHKQSFILMDSIVHSQAQAEPFVNLQFEAKDMTLEWFNTLNNNNLTNKQGVGSIAEVISDMSQRVGGYTAQTSNQIAWAKQTLDIKLENDSLQHKATTRIDSLSQTFNRLVSFFEGSPIYISDISTQVNEQMITLVQTLERSLNSSFNNSMRSISTERDSLQVFFNTQRQELINQLNDGANDIIQNTLSQLPKLVGRITIYLVISLIILFSLPLILGYSLGRLKERKIQKKNGNTNNTRD